MGSFYKSAAAEDSAVVSTSAINLEELFVTNIGGSARFVHIFDAGALPADGAVPDVCIAIPDATTVSWDPTEVRGNTLYSSGLVIALSSTGATLTVTTGDEGTFQVRAF